MMFLPMNFGLLSSKLILIDDLNIDRRLGVTGPSLTVPASTSLFRRRSAPAELCRTPAAVAGGASASFRVLLFGRTCCQGLESNCPSSGVVTSMIWVLSTEPLGGTDSPRVLRNLDASRFRLCFSLKVRQGVFVAVDDTASTEESDLMDPADALRASA